jgi:hypothetical protein
MNGRAQGVLPPRLPLPRASLGVPEPLVSEVGVIPRFFVRHRLLLAMLVTSTLIGALCAKLNTSGNLEVAAATTHVLIDYPNASIVDRVTLPQDLSSLQNRAELYARLMTSTPVLTAIGRRAGLPPDQISGVADITAPGPIQFLEAGSEEHANQIRASRAPYRLELQADPGQPILAIYTEAPTLGEALRLANSAILGLQDYMRELARQQGFPAQELPQLRQLGSARGGVTNGSARVVIGGLTFITAFALSLVVMFALISRPSRRREHDVHTPARRPGLTGRPAYDWPRTTRLMPWAIAGLIAMFWLTPFDRIQLGVSAPINITLDRIVLPLVAVLWLIAFTAGPGGAPRLRITRVHIAMGAYLACAFLSAVLDAHYLNHTGELTLALKKLPLLVSYISIFVIVASSVRRSEVPAFLTFTLVLAVVVGLEAIYEYHTHHNLFLSWSSKLFVGPFKLAGVDPTSASALDSQGRFWVEGPTGYGVELIMMLSIALPIAVLRFLKCKTRKKQLLYGLAIIVLPYAMLATDRKSALVVPVAVFLTLAYFRRRQLLSLAPLGLVVAILLVAASPASLRNVISQFTSSTAGQVATVSSRTVNFDAIRPDLWTHLLLGRGQGTYAPPTDRIIDSDILLPLIETGVLGLVTFLLVPVSVIVVARKTASARQSRSSPAALCGVAAALCVLVATMLYSVMSLPHGPDVFMYVVGLAVVAVGAEDAQLVAAHAERTDRSRRHPTRARLRVHAGPERAVPAGRHAEVRTARPR